MEWPTLTHDQYEALGGTAGESDLKDLLPAAERHVRSVIWPNVPDTDAKADAYRAALAAAVDVDRQWGGSHGVRTGGSVTVGRFSESEGSGDGETAYDAEMRRAVREALAGSGLLCKVAVFR